MKKFKNSHELVSHILSEFPETRADDIELIFKCWELQHVRFDRFMIDMIKAYCFSPESITRERRKIQERGELLPEKGQRSFL